MSSPSAEPSGVRSGRTTDDDEHDDHGERDDEPTAPGQPHRALRAASVVGMQASFRAPQLPRPRHDLHRTGDAVSPEEQVVAAGELPGLDAEPSCKVIFVPGGDVAAGLDDAVVTQGDPDAGVRADQAALADR